MADKQIKKLNNIFFYGVAFTALDASDVTLDIITNIRRRFLISKKPASNKLYRNAQGNSYVYSYNFSFQKPLQWRVTRNKKVIEEIVPLMSGKYCINVYDEQGKDTKKVFFDSKHRWFKTNYYNVVSNETLSCSIVPKEFDEGTSLLKYVTGEVYPLRLYPCTVPSCEIVRNRLLARIPTPQVTALTDRGVMYFVDEDDKDNYEHILSEEEECYRKETAPKVYISKEDADTGFNLNVKDFDMSKNLNRTFDISLAQDFGVDSQPESAVSAAMHEADILYNQSIEITSDSVDDAITEAVEQINSLTSLDIDADDILKFDIKPDIIPANEIADNFDNITVKDTDEIDIQLRHIDSVLDDSLLLTAERKLIIGDSVVDDDYISSIIDGIITSAFGKELGFSEPSNDFTNEDNSDSHTEQIGESIDTDANADVDVNPEIYDENADSNTDTNIDAPVEQSEVDREFSLAVAEANFELTLPMDEYLNLNPADSVIESRGETYSYFGQLSPDGKRNGRGRTLMSDGSIAYEGEYLDDKRHGQGSFYFKDGSLCYWGNWHSNNRMGFGVGVSSADNAVHAGVWSDNKPTGVGARFDADGNLMFLSSSCEDKKKGFTISDVTDTAFTVRVWNEKTQSFVQREITLDDIIN